MFTGAITARLVIVDLDGTLLDGAGDIPPTFWPLLETMRTQGIVFAPASGRQYATLRHLFGTHGDDLTFIAENGGLVMRGGVEISSILLEHDTIALTRNLLTADTAEGADIGLVVCGKDTAYVERTDAAFLAEVAKYYVDFQIVDDLTLVEADVVKLAMFRTSGTAAGVPRHLSELTETHQVTVSGTHWIDVMPRATNKGSAVRALQRHLDIDRSETVAFGDYLNDLEMLDAAEHSFAMANAHPHVKERARWEAPANTRNGVISTLSAILHDQ
ncbi:MAG: Cof-type HAD-IIB family hydrolase [Microbacterium sp.]